MNKKKESYFEINELVGNLLDLKSFNKNSVLIAALNTNTFQIVRCEKCRHIRRWDDGQITCAAWTDQWDMPTELNGYCHLGELTDES